MNWWDTDETHDPALPCWVEGAADHADFPIQNLPFGIFSPRSGNARIGVAIGDRILDIAACAAAGLLPDPVRRIGRDRTLNRLMAIAPCERRQLRRFVSTLLSRGVYRSLVEPMLHDASDCALHLPMQVGDYTDFYVGIHHATNVGRLLRPDNPLLPNYRHIPIAYHGRASSVRVSGDAVVRPSGQRRDADAAAPVYAPTCRLDYELEMGVWIGAGNAPGDPIAIGRAHQHIAGLCLLNDWSARDFQAWEYQPLGPFLAKSFHTSVSPWIVTTEALAPFRVRQPDRDPGDPAPLPYLNDADDRGHGAYAIMLEASILTAAMRARGDAPCRLASGPATSMYWTVGQMVAHHASNGCNLNPGDLLGTGTLSAPSRDGLGSLMELTENGRLPVCLPNGEERTFLQDGDEVILSAKASAPGFAPIGFGVCRAVVQPAWGDGL